jgi:hypothetical protein
MDEDVEIRALRDIVDGFNKQALAIPTIALRFLELEGHFTKEEVADSMELYKDILTTKFSGRNLTVCQVAAYYALAELVLQVRESQTREIQKPMDHDRSYG